MPEPSMPTMPQFGAMGFYGKQATAQAPKNADPFSQTDVEPMAPAFGGMHPFLQKAPQAQAAGVGMPTASSFGSFGSMGAFDTSAMINSFE